jgi:hypothetical protein
MHMLKARKFNWYFWLQSLFCFLLPFISGLTTMYTAPALNDAQLIALSNECAAADNSKAYLEYTINSKQNGDSQALSYFASYYAKNFDGKTSHLVCSSENNKLLRYSLNFDDVNISNQTVLSTVVTYSNQNKRFESICIELLKDRPISEELAYPNWGGEIALVWLPDYFGDMIIEKNSTYTTYDDIINADVPLYLTLSDSSQKRCKIVNFFHVRGFTENYSSEDEYYQKNDYNFGSMLSYYLGDFIFTTDNNLADSPSKSIVAMIGTKRFDFSEYLDSISTFYSSNNIFIEYSKVVNSEKVQLTGYENLIDYHNGQNAPGQIILFVVYIVNLFVLLISFYFLFKNRRLIDKKHRLFLLGNIGTLGFIGIIVQLLRVSICKNAYLFLLFFNKFFGIALLITFISLMVTFCGAIYENKC